MPTRRASISRYCNARSTRCADLRSPCATWPSSNPTSTLGSRPPRGSTGTCVYNEPAPNPFVRATSWHIPQPLDLAALRNASIPLVGTHDFTSFCKRTRTVRPATTETSFVRAVRRAEWSRSGDGMLVFEIEARSFGRQMVRSIVGHPGRHRPRAGAGPAKYPPSSLPGIATSPGRLRRPTAWSCGWCDFDELCLLRRVRCSPCLLFDPSGPSLVSRSSRRRVSACPRPRFERRGALSCPPIPSK